MHPLGLGYRHLTILNLGQPFCDSSEVGSTFFTIHLIGHKGKGWTMANSHVGSINMLGKQHKHLDPLIAPRA